MATTNGKPDTNTTVSETDGRDTMPSSLGERQARSYRAAPSYYRGTAIAVVGSDGADLSANLPEILFHLTVEIRKLRRAMSMVGTAADLGDLDHLS